MKKFPVFCGVITIGLLFLLININAGDKKENLFEDYVNLEDGDVLSLIEAIDLIEEHYIESDHETSEKAWRGSIEGVNEYLLERKKKNGLGAEKTTAMQHLIKSFRSFFLGKTQKNSSNGKEEFINLFNSTLRQDPQIDVADLVNSAIDGALDGVGHKYNFYLLKEERKKRDGVAYSMTTGMEARSVAPCVGYVKLQTLIGRDVSNIFESKMSDIFIDCPRRSLILDLRNNTGGCFFEALKISNLFMREGQIATYHRKQEILRFVSDSTKSGNIPIILLVNQYTASAAELVAASLMSLGKTKILGEDATTLGKSLAQSEFILPNGNVIEIVSGYVLLARNENINGRGIKVDHILSREEIVRFLNMFEKGDEWAQDENNDPIIHLAYEHLKIPQD